MTGLFFGGRICFLGLIYCDRRWLLFFSVHIRLLTKCKICFTLGLSNYFSLKSSSCPLQSTQVSTKIISESVSCLSHWHSWFHGFWIATLWKKGVYYASALLSSVFPTSMLSFGALSCLYCRTLSLCSVSCSFLCWVSFSVLLFVVLVLYME